TEYTEPAGHHGDIQSMRTTSVTISKTSLAQQITVQETSSHIYDLSRTQTASPEGLSNVTLPDTTS
ncbi:hypothetical protein BaRGS_00022067, partial [Batillaria attramentaria]